MPFLCLLIIFLHYKLETLGFIIPIFCDQQARLVASSPALPLLHPTVPMGDQSNSPSSSIDSSSSHPALCTTSSIFQTRRDLLSTDLKLGLGLSASALHGCSSKERSTLEEKVHRSHSKTFFVKVYMEGLPIGRKLDLFSHSGYDSLTRTLRRMFRTTIICPDTSRVPPEKAHVLTYEDKEGDWMMVGDVPWELFLRTVKRLKITRADKC
ncbi:auxin-responsive protein IAA4-like isoform X2 [Musa acuminata AAA Group]|uniref:auxin-responsive protein IAA4-like isoform X2 n=1 Tax=Musa acuminata AAA Group TaxID=214697 RepID=UPI0031D994A7